MWKGKALHAHSNLFIIAACLLQTPLGTPVEPEVKST
jgi:hypothetical protein